MVACPLLWSLLLLTIQSPTISAADPVPKLWDEEALETMTLPAALPGTRILYLSSAEYHRIPERPAWKSYPVYGPGQEPSGYLEWLKRQEPERVFEEKNLKSVKAWVAAGQRVYNTPYELQPLEKSYVRDADWWRALKPPLLKNGSILAYRYIIRERGKIEVGWNSCAACHSRVMPDGNVIEGAQGNFPVAAAAAFEIRKAGPAVRKLVDAERSHDAALIFPNIPKDDRAFGLYKLTAGEIADAYEAVIPGMAVRFGFSFQDMPKIADLIGLKRRKFLDMTARFVHRGPGDIMRYAASCAGGNYFFSSLTNLPPEAVPPISEDSWRPQAAAYYAATLYIYSLKPPRNPNLPKSSSERATVRRGKEIFMESCAKCHTPPFYTNNKLIAAPGFNPPPDHPFRDDIVRTISGEPRRIGNDPRSAVLSYRGRGFYKVPSLLGVWYRGPFEHNGSVATLEDWFDERRLTDDYVPTGFKGYGVKTRAVKGHEFGLDLPADEKAALIAFLRSL